MRWALVLTAMAAVGVASRAEAQDSKAGAVMAYDQAEQLMAAGKIKEACARYADSQKLDPQLGTLLHLADCLEQNGQTASAWAGFRDAAELAQQKGDPRQELAEQRAKALSQRLSQIQINVPQGTNVRVERDGVEVGSTSLGVPVPIDPGDHTVVVTAPGYRAWQRTVTVPSGAGVTGVDVPALEKEGAAPPATTPAPAAEPPTEKSSIGSRWPALVAAGVGVAGVAVGSVFGLKSMSKADDAKAYCRPDNSCWDNRGLALKEDAIAAGNVSTIAFVVGGVGLAAGAVLWFTLPDGSEGEHADAGTLRLGLGPGSVELGGSF